MAVLLLPFAALAAQPSAPANVGAADVVAAFQQFCTPEFPDTSAIALKAGLTGWVPVPSLSGARRIKGMTFQKDYLVFSKFALIATVGPAPKDPSVSSCSVSGPVGVATLTELSGRAASSLKLPQTVPLASDNEVEWKFRDGRVITAHITRPRSPMTANAANIMISAPKADQ